MAATDGASNHDWSFAQLARSETIWGPHGYHRYPAKFIPQLAARIIAEYSQPGFLVGDPFSGSGTTGVEALRAGRQAWLGDISPIAVLISRAKCRPIAPHILQKEQDAFEGVLSSLPHIGKRRLTVEEKNAISQIDISHASDEERWRYWFPEPHRRVLCDIINRISAIDAEEIRLFYLCAFSNVLRGCSIWLSGSTKPQKDIEKAIADPVDSFRRQLKDMYMRNTLFWTELSATGSLVNGEPSCRVDLADARALPLPDESMDLLVTSPPYSTCYEYAQLHQLTHLWLSRYGLLPVPKHSDALSTSAAPIGSKVLSQLGAEAITKNRNHTAAGIVTAQVPRQLPLTGSSSADTAIEQLIEKAHRTNSSEIHREARTLQMYFQDMDSCIGDFARVLTAEAKLVLVIGDSRKRGVTIPTSDALCELAAGRGFTLVRRILRQIPARILTRTRDASTGRFSSTAQHDTQAYPEEDILVFRRA